MKLLAVRQQRKSATTVEDIPLGFTQGRGYSVLAVAAENLNVVRRDGEENRWTVQNVHIQQGRGTRGRKSQTRSVARECVDVNGS